MPAMASNPRGVRLSVGEMKLPAALLTRPVRPPVANSSLTMSSTFLCNADVHAKGVDATLRKLRAPDGSGFIAHAFAPATNGNVSTQSQKFFSHGFAKTRATPGDQNALTRHQIVLKHGFPLIVHLSDVSQWPGRRVNRHTIVWFTLMPEREDRATLPRPINSQ